MISTLTHRLAVLVALSGATLAVTTAVLLGSPTSAQASTSPYCNNQLLGGYEGCVGAPRMLYATFGWGDDHSVCVSASQYAQGYPALGNGPACSSGPGSGVFWEPGGGITAYLYPYIQNHAAGANRVHGVAYQP